MDLRMEELLDLKTFTQNVETEVTMLLQSLQWDRKRLLEGTSTATCQYDANHKMPTDNLETHESKCILRSLGYAETDELLPDPPDDRAHTLVKFNSNEIQRIINEASKADPLFKKGAAASQQPRSLSRLQLVYSADERRALHDAVVAAVPSCHDLGDLALASSNEGSQQGAATKSRVEILAELRNMKRRRAKYRVAAKTKNYSDVLRDVIKTQMESYTEAVSNTLSVKPEENEKHNQTTNVYDIQKFRNYTSGKYENVTSRERSEERSRVVVRESSVATRSTYDDHHKESRHREEKRRKETSNKRYEDRQYRSDTRERHYESLRDKKMREEDKHRETSREKYRSGSEHSTKRHGKHGRDKSRSEEKNGHKVGKETDRRKDYEYDDRRSESRHYKEKCTKIKVEAVDQNMSGKSGLSKHLHKSNSKTDRRSRSGDRSREDRKRRHREEYESSGHRDVPYKRYYDVEVKREEF